MFFHQAFCEEGNIEENGILAFAKFVIFSVLETRDNKGWCCIYKLMNSILLKFFFKATKFLWTVDKNFDVIVIL